MSIINEALKKARREGNPAGTPPDDETVIHPRQRASSGPGIWMILSAILVVLVFVALVAGLGYFVYAQYFGPTEDGDSFDPPVTEKMAKPAEEKKSTSPEKPEKADPKGTLTVRSSSEPAEELRAEPSPPPPSHPVVVPATEEILSQFSVNGVMRGGSSIRVITNSGVYQVGDMVSSPPGFRVQSIGEDFLLLRSPDGNSHRIPLP